MALFFDKETATLAGQPQDTGKLLEIDAHELMRKEDSTEQLASFDEVRAVGKWFLNQDFNAVLTSSKPLPADLLLRHEANQGGSFLGKLALGPDAESQFPVTVESIRTPQGRDLRLHIVPIHFGALEVAPFENHTDSLLALAAAAAAAPQFILALEGGIETTQCSTKKETVTSITPDHGTPLAVTFDAFDFNPTTLNTAIGVTGNQDLSIKRAAHLHGQNKPNTEKISRAAAGSKIAGGVPIRTVLRSELPKHVLFISTFQDDISGQAQIETISQSLWKAGIKSGDLSFLSAVLGFTAQVVGDGSREKVVEKMLTPEQADLPLRELFTR